MLACIDTTRVIGIAVCLAAFALAAVLIAHDLRPRRRNQR